MKTSRSHRGFTLVQVLIGAMLMGVVATAFLAIVQVTYRSQQTVMGQNGADTTVRTALDSLIDNLRSAQNQQTPAQGQPAGCFTAAGASSFTLNQAYYDYTQSPPAQVWYTVQYWVNTSVSPHTLEETTVKNGVTTTVPIAQGVSSLTLTYYTSGGVYTPATSSWVTTANPNSPTTAEMPNIGAVQVGMTVTTWDGYTRTLTSMVRLMNSPYLVVQ